MKFNNVLTFELTEKDFKNSLDTLEEIQERLYASSLFIISPNKIFGNDNINDKNGEYFLTK